MFKLMLPIYLFIYLFIFMLLCSKFKSDGKYVMTSIHEGSAREHMLQQTLDQLQARKVHK